MLRARIELHALEPAHAPALSIPESQEFFLGRSAGSGISAPEVSRVHCKLFWKGARLLQITALKKPVYIQRPGEALHPVLPADAPAKITPGSKLYLLDPARHALPCSYVWREDEPAKHGSAPIGGQSPQASRKRKQPQPCDAASRERERSVPKLDQDTPDTPGRAPTELAPAGNGIFSGCVAFFLANMHTHVLRSRFQERGGRLASSVQPAVTHVVCPEGRQLAQNEVTQFAKALGDWRAVRSTPAGNGGGSPTKTCSPGSCAGRPPSLSVARQHMQGMHFVTVHWVSASIAAGQRLSEVSFAAEDVEAAIGALGPAASNAAGSQGTGPALESRRSTAAGTGVDPSQACELNASSRTAEVPAKQSSRPPTSSNAAMEHPKVATGEARVVLPADATHACTGKAQAEEVIRDPYGPQSTVEGWGLTQWGPAGWTSADWGRGDVWLEPFDVASARATLRELYVHYHRLELAEQSSLVISGSQVACAEDAGFASVHAPCGHIACAAALTCIIAELETSLTFYVRGKGADTFRLFNTKRAINRLRSAATPLRSEADVQALGLGKKSHDKVMEILSAGSLARNTVMKSNEEAIAMQRFCSLWGVGPVKAQEWIGQGFRTVDNVRADADAMAALSSRERAGVVHAEDFEQRIPREEAVVASRLVCRQVIQQICQLTGCSEAEALAGLHARALGSFCRGKASTGDVDVLVVLGNGGQRTYDVCCLNVLAAVVRALHADGVVTADVALPEHAGCMLCGGRDREVARHSASWLGVCYVPGFPCVARRLDIKVYPPGQRATAVNYFTGSGLFNRALRFWAGRPNARVCALAAARLPDGTHFHLSDTVLTVRTGGSTPLRGAPELARQDSETEVTAVDSAPRAAVSKVVGPDRHLDKTVCEHEIAVWSETDIFKTLGLAYVPAFMRHFHDVSS